VSGTAGTGRHAPAALDSAPVTSAAGHVGRRAHMTSRRGTTAATATGVNDPGGAGRALDSAAIAAGVAAVGVQIAYPLLAGAALRAATVGAVLLFATASVLHAGGRLGARAAAVLLIGAGGLALVAEAVGVATGLPFGRYAYAQSLGPQVLGVPLLVPVAWVMMAYPALLAARRLAAGRGRLAVAAVGGGTLAAWDLFLDPQMVAAGHWTWASPSPSLPGVADVPLGNTAGWLVVGTAITALLDRLLPRPPVETPAAAEALPLALLVWTWLGSVVANVAFFGRPWVAVLGGATLGLVAVPSLVVLLRGVLRRDGAAVPA
jgi:uncharacterized membrane protein